MPRKMSAEREREFNELNAYISFYATHVWRIDPDDKSHPAHTVNLIVKGVGRSRALEGLRQAANDTIEEARDFSPAEVAELDQIFRAHGVLTISEVRYRYAGSLRRIIKRGKIRDETEYYLVNGIVVDLANGVTDEDRDVLQSLLLVFEKSIPGVRSP